MNEQNGNRHAQYNPDNTYLPSNPSNPQYVTHGQSDVHNEMYVPSTPHYILVQASHESTPNVRNVYNHPILRHIPSSPPPPYSSPAPNTYNPAYSGPEPQVYDPTQPIMPVFRAPREQELPSHMFRATRRIANTNRSQQINKHQILDAYKRALLSCICCFIPLGLIAVWHANKAHDFSKEDFGKAENEVRESLKYSKLSCQVGTILVIVYFILIVIIVKQFA